MDYWCGECPVCGNDMYCDEDMKYPVCYVCIEREMEEAE